MGVKKLYQADEEILFDIGGKGKTKVTIPKGGILFGIENINGKNKTVQILHPYPKNQKGELALSTKSYIWPNETIREVEMVNSDKVLEHWNDLFVNALLQPENWTDPAWQPILCSKISEINSLEEWKAVMSAYHKSNITGDEYLVDCLRLKGSCLIEDQLNKILQSETDDMAQNEIWDDFCYAAKEGCSFQKTTIAKILILPVAYHSEHITDAIQMIGDLVEFTDSIPPTTEKENVSNMLAKCLQVALCENPGGVKPYLARVLRRTGATYFTQNVSSVLADAAANYMERTSMMESRINKLREEVDQKRDEEARHLEEISAECSKYFMPLKEAILNLPREDFEGVTTPAEAKEIVSDLVAQIIDTYNRTASKMSNIGIDIGGEIRS